MILLTAKIFPAFVISSGSRDISDLNSQRFLDYARNDKEVRAVGPHSLSREVITANEADAREKHFGLRHSFGIRHSQRLTPHVENAAALLAAHNFVATFSVYRRRRCHFHMTSGANTVLNRYHGCVPFARE